MRGPYILIGDQRGPKAERRLSALGYGRVWVATRLRPVHLYSSSERWALDNGRFAAWRNGVPWDEGVFLAGFEKSLETAGRAPLWAVLPDTVGDWPATLDTSARWAERLEGRAPWYLALQDGATAPDVRAFGPVSGLFLGGTDAFKHTAPMWADLARELDVGFHFARCSSRARIATAFRIGASSLDSTQGQWSRDHWTRWVGHIEHARNQPDIFDAGA